MNFIYIEKTWELFVAALTWYCLSVEKEEEEEKKSRIEKPEPRAILRHFLISS